MQGGNARQRGKTAGVHGDRGREADLSPECHTDVIMPQPYIPIFVDEKEKKTETATSKLFSGFTRGNARFSPHRNPAVSFVKRKSLLFIHGS